MLSSSNPVLSLGLYSHCYGLPWPISSLWGFLGPFYSFGHLQPVSFPRASLTFSNPSFPWVFTKSFGFPAQITISFTFGVYRLFHQPHLLNSFLWAPSAHFFLLSISHNAHGFTISFFELLWARLLSLRPFYYFRGLWTIILAIQS